MPPELFRREKYSEVDLNLIETVDMFGVAIVTYILFYGRHPFSGTVNGSVVYDRVRQLSCDWQLDSVCLPM